MPPKQEPKKNNTKQQHFFRKCFFCLLVWCCRLFSFFVLLDSCFCFDCCCYCCCCCCCCCYRCLLFCCFVLFWGTPTKENTNKKQQNPLFYSVFCAIVFRGLWPQKGQQPKGKKNRSFLPGFSRKRFFLQKEAFGCRVVVVFWGVFLFFFD